MITDYIWNPTAKRIGQKTQREMRKSYHRCVKPDTLLVTETLYKITK